jgi:hypothetical protein
MAEHALLIVAWFFSWIVNQLTSGTKTLTV